jgi:hypothetical protein
MHIGVCLQVELFEDSFDPRTRSTLRSIVH